MADIDDEIAALKTRLAQLEAQKAATTPPSPVQPIIDGPAKNEHGAAKPLLLAVGCVLALFVALVVIGSLQPSQTPSKPASTPVQATAPVAPPEPAKPAPPLEPVYAWRYDEDVDSMSDRKTLTACVNSTDTVNLDSPYEPVTAALCIRNSPKFGFDVFFKLNGDGQILCDSYDGCTIKIRYGEAPAGRNGALTAADHSSNIIFLTGARNVAARLAKAKTTLMELTYYQAGSQTVSFPTAGLDLAKVGLGGGRKKKD